MPRKLPWASTKSCPSPPSKRQRTTYTVSTPTTPSASLSTPNNTNANVSDDNSNDNGTPAYMIPSDERYIMVEDEFLTIAQTYTRSVHRAEYKRLQSLATTKNASRITEIQRPVAGVTRMSREILARRRAKEGVLRELPPVRGGDESSDEGESAAKRVWGRSSLGDLMCSPKKRERDLSARWKILPGTRAAAGFLKAEVDGGARRRLAARSQEMEDGIVGKAGVQRKPPPIKQELTKQEATASDTTSSSENDDDDLDAPIRASQFSSQSQLTNSRLPSQASSIGSNLGPIPPPPSRSIPPPSRSSTFPSLRSASQPLPNLTRHLTAPLSRPHSSQPAPSSSPPPPATKKPPPDFDFDFGLVAAQRSMYRGRSMAARKQAEQRVAPPPSPSREARRDGLLGKLFPVAE